MNTNGNDLVFCEFFKVGEIARGEGGLTKREYFAALALQGFSSNGALRFANNDQLVALSVSLADALMIELNKEVNS